MATTYNVYVGDSTYNYGLAANERGSTYTASVIPFTTKSSYTTHETKKKSSYGIIYHKPTVPVFTLQSDEYPTKIQYVKDPYDSLFISYNVYAGANCKLYLSDENGEKSVMYTSCSFGKYDGQHPVTCWANNYKTSTFNISGAEKLAGKQLCLKITGSDTVGLYGKYKILLTTNYVSTKKVTINASSGIYAKDQVCFLSDGSPLMDGSKYVSTTTLARGKTIILKGIPSVAGHILNGFTTSLGDEPVKNNDGTFTFTMPTPAEDVTLTPIWGLAINDVTVVSSPIGAGSVSFKVDGKTDTSAQFGSTVTLFQTLIDKEYKFNKWTINSGTLANDGISFTMPATRVVATANYTARSLIFKDSSFTTDQENFTLTVTRNADAIDSFGSEISYYLYKNDIQVAMFENGSKTTSIVLTEAEVNSNPKPEIVLKLVAKSMNLNDKAKIDSLTNQLSEIVEGTNEWYEVKRQLDDARSSARYVEAHGVPVTMNANDVYKTVNYYINGQYERCIMHYYVDGEFVEVWPYVYDPTKKDEVDSVTGINKRWQLCSAN